MKSTKETIESIKYLKDEQTKKQKKAALAFEVL